MPGALIFNDIFNDNELVKNDQTFDYGPFK